MPSIEKIIKLKPDLVIGTPGIYSVVARKLEEQGIQTLLSYIEKWLDLERLTTTLAALVTADPQPLLLLYQNIIINNQLVNTPSTLILTAREPILAPNKNSWTGDFVKKLSTDNITSEAQDSSPR